MIHVKVVWFRTNSHAFIRFVIFVTEEKELTFAHTPHASHSLLSPFSASAGPFSCCGCQIWGGKIPPKCNQAIDGKMATRSDKQMTEMRGSDSQCWGQSLRVACAVYVVVYVCVSSSEWVNATILCIYPDCLSFCLWATTVYLHKPEWGWHCVCVNVGVDAGVLQSLEFQWLTPRPFIF